MNNKNQIVKDKEDKKEIGKIINTIVVSLIFAVLTAMIILF